MPQEPISLPAVDVSVDGAPPFQPESLLGTVVAGRYRLSGHLASGGMAAVYVAEDTVARRDVALKLLRPDLEQSPEIVRQFLCEGAIASLVEHEHVVRVLDHGGDDAGPHYIAMELLEGEGLFDRLRRQGPLSPQEAVSILVQVCAGLEAAHRRGIVHRDLKPENVFLHGRGTSTPVVKLLDFGVARAADVEAGDKGLVVGTPEYLSPEQAYGQVVDARSDVYSAGVVAWRMLAGHAPFSAPSRSSIIRRQAREPVPPLTDARPELAAWPALVATVARACAKDPAARQQSAVELAEELALSLARPGTLPSLVPVPGVPDPGPRPRSAPRPEPEAAAPPRPPASSRPGRPARVAALAGLVAALAAAAVALHLHSRTVPHAQRLLLEGRSADALALLAPEVKDRPHDAAVHAIFARALLAASRPADALDQYEEAARLDPSALSEPDAEGLATLLPRGGRTAERAARLLDQARGRGVAGVPGAVAAWGPLLDDADCDVRRVAVASLEEADDPAALSRLDALAARREEPPPGTAPGGKPAPACGAVEAGEAVARLRSAAPGGAP